MGKLRNGTAIVVSALHADAHLILKSAADGVCRSEAFFVNKLTGRAKAHIIEDRHNKTEKTQELIKAMPGLIGASVRGVFTSSKNASKEHKTEDNIAADPIVQ